MFVIMIPCCCKLDQFLQVPLLSPGVKHSKVVKVSSSALVIKLVGSGLSSMLNHEHVTLKRKLSQAPNVRKLCILDMKKKNISI